MQVIHRDQCSASTRAEIPQALRSLRGPREAAFFHAMREKIACLLQQERSSSKGGGRSKRAAWHILAQESREASRNLAREVYAKLTRLFSTEVDEDYGCGDRSKTKRARHCSS